LARHPHIHCPRFRRRKLAVFLPSAPRHPHPPPPCRWPAAHHRFRRPRPARAPAEKRPFHLPIFIAFEDLRLRDAHLRIDTLDLRLGSIEGRGRIQGNRLDIDTARLLDADLRDDRPRPPPPMPPLPWYDALAPDRRPAIDLPDIHLPLDVRVQSFEMDRATLDFGGEPQRIHALRFSADGLGNQLTVRRLRLDHELGVAEAAGDIQLSGDYPLDLSIQLRSEHLLPPHALSLDSHWTGSLAKLRFTASLDGIGALEASGVIHPLDPHLPIQASLAWAELAWPLEGPPIAASPSGRLALEGTLDDYSLELDAKLSGPSIPDGHWSLRANGDLHQLVLAPLRSELLGGSIQIDGALSWTNGVVWEASLAAETLDAAALHPKAPAQVAAQATSTGRWSPDGWQVDIDVASATGDWRGYPLALDGRAEGSSAVGWRTPGLRIAVRENHVLVAGSFADELDFSGELSLPDPGEFLPGLTGQVEGTWALRGPPATPDVILSLRAERIAYLDQIQLDAARIETSIASLAFAESRIRIELDSLSLPAQNLTFHSIRLQGDGTRIAHRTTLDAEGENASLSLVLHGALQEDTFAWTGTLDRAALAAAGIDWTLAEPLPLRWDSATHQLVAVPHRWRHAQAELSATQPLVLGASGSAQLQLAGFDLAEFHPWLPEDIRLRGTLAAAADLRWAPGALPQGEVSLDLREAGVHLIVATNDLYIDDAPPLDVAFESVALRARLAETNFSARFDLVAPGLGTARAQASATLLSGPAHRHPYGGNHRPGRAPARHRPPFLPELRHALRRNPRRHPLLRPPSASAPARHRLAHQRHRRTRRLSRHPGRSPPCKANCTATARNGPADSAAAEDWPPSRAIWRSATTPGTPSCASPANVSIWPMAPSPPCRPPPTCACASNPARYR
jgi:translocation and assembly module TamB